MQNNVLMPGDAAGNYDKKWIETFDLKFLILWLLLFVLLLSWTVIFDSGLFSAKEFFLKSCTKLFVMMILALAGGLTIEDNTMISLNCTIATNNHDFYDRYVITCKPVHIKRNV